MFWRRRDPRDFDAEISAHLQLEAERLREQGLEPNEASMAARRAFGNLTRTQEKFYESQLWFYYGVVSYGITRRMNEFGIRMALGAERQDVLWMVLRETAKLVLGGVGLGLVLALASTRLVQTQFFGVNFYDPFVVAAAIAGMLIVALFAGYFPARRATRIDPLLALRYE